MKSLKTYNMDRDVIQLLKRASNKSQVVNQSVRRYYRQQSEFKGFEASTFDLIRWLLDNSRSEQISPQLRSLLQIEMSELINKNQG